MGKADFRIECVIDYNHVKAVCLEKKICKKIYQIFTVVGKRDDFLFLFCFFWMIIMNIPNSYYGFLLICPFIRVTLDTCSR